MTAVTRNVEGIDRAQLDAQQRQIPFDPIERPTAHSLVEAAELLNISPAEIVKSLVVRRREGEYLFALVPGDRKISWPKLRSLLGANKLTLPAPEEALSVTGYERGTITPLGSTTAWPVVADSRISGRISMGAGAHGYSAFTDAEALIRGLNATVADITDPL